MSRERQDFIANMHQELEKKIESIAGKPAAAGVETRTDPHKEGSEAADTRAQRRRQKQGLQFAFKSMTREQYQKAQQYIFKSDAPPPGNYRARFDAVEK